MKETGVGPARPGHGAERKVLDMRLFRGKIPAISRDIVRVLREAGDIEVTDAEVGEVERDVSAILNEYLKVEALVNEKTKDIMEKRRIDQKDFARTKRIVAEEMGFFTGDEGIEYLINQIIEAFMHSRFVEEVFAEDHVLRRKMIKVFREHLDIDEELDHEVRQRIKNLTEGTAAWEAEYTRILEQLKRIRGLS